MRQALELLETCLKFLQSTGTASQTSPLEIGSMTLGKYASETLLLPEPDFGGSSCISQKLQLKHAAGVWKLLRDAVLDAEDQQQGGGAAEKEPRFLRAVRGKYRSPLSEGDKKELEQASSKMDLPILLAVMQEAAEAWLSEDTLGAKRPLSETLAFMQVMPLFQESAAAAGPGEQEVEKPAVEVDEDQLLGEIREREAVVAACVVGSNFHKAQLEHLNVLRARRASSKPLAVQQMGIQRKLEQAKKKRAKADEAVELARGLLLEEQAAAALAHEEVAGLERKLKDLHQRALRGSHMRSQCDHVGWNTWRQSEAAHALDHTDVNLAEAAGTLQPPRH